MPASSPHLRPPAQSGDPFDDWQLDREDIARDRALLKKKSKCPDDAPGMEIGGGGRKRSVKLLIAYGLLLAAIAAVFTVLFFQFTANLRIALAVVLAMLLYMLFTARMAEGKFDSRT